VVLFWCHGSIRRRKLQGIEIIVQNENSESTEKAELLSIQLTVPQLFETSVVDVYWRWEKSTNSTNLEVHSSSSLGLRCNVQLNLLFLTLAGWHGDPLRGDAGDIFIGHWSCGNIQWIIFDLFSICSPA
jgi:hypothetical protein